MRSDARVNTGYLACPSGRRPGLDKEERKESVFVENVDSLAAPVVTSQGASKKQSSQLSIECQGPSGRQPGSLSDLPELATKDNLHSSSGRWPGLVQVRIVRIAVVRVAVVKKEAVQVAVESFI